MCVDAWLTSWRTFCPVCKRDARTSNGEPPATESTPLLSSAPGSMDSSSILSSFRSSLASSSAIQIGLPSSSRTPPFSRPQSTASTPYNHSSLISHHQSPHLSASRSSVDLRNMSSPQRSQGAYLVSPHSLGYPSLSSINSRYMSPYIPSPGIGSSYLGSSSLRGSHLPYGESVTNESRPLHYSESATSFSPFASAQSLPGC